MSQPYWRVIAAAWLLFACNDESSGRVVDPRTAPLTYWQDIAPLMAERCLQCHSEGGIAPIRLDGYERVESLAGLIEHVTGERRMPPWSATSDGSCRELSDSIALSDAEIERIADWAQAGAVEGTPVDIERPELPVLARATEFVTPEFVPVAQGGELAEFDEYRCFALDAPAGPRQFITGYEVNPGAPEIVHHVLAMLIDPEALAADPEQPTRTNLEQMQLLDAQSPEREGWPCFGMAGKGVAIEALPVAWGPGQGIVTFPGDSGVPLRPEHKIVIQVHYNLADPDNAGTTDRTTVRLQLASQVERVGVFALPDPLLESLGAEVPVTLPPGQASTLYQWKQTAKQLGLPTDADVQLHGVAPHMHERGRKYRMTLANPDEAEQCAIDVQRWDFHWQRTYFYQQPWTINADTQFSVTCDYDTRGASEPVRPGWGTRNEMCLASLYFSVPLAAVDNR